MIIIIQFHGYRFRVKQEGKQSPPSPATARWIFQPFSLNQIDWGAPEDLWVVLS